MAKEMIILCFEKYFSNLLRFVIVWMYFTFQFHHQNLVRWIIDWWEGINNMATLRRNYSYKFILKKAFSAFKCVVTNYTDEKESVSDLNYKTGSQNMWFLYMWSDERKLIDRCTKVSIDCMDEMASKLAAMKTLLHL